MVLVGLGVRIVLVSEIGLVFMFVGASDGGDEITAFPLPFHPPVGVSFNDVHGNGALTSDEPTSSVG